MFNRSYIQGHEGHPHYFTDSKVNSLQKSVSFSGDEEELLRIIKNLSDPTKLKIYLLLHKIEEIPVADITQILEMNQSAVSHALSDLKNLGLVESHRCGKLICYSRSRGKKKNKFLSFLTCLNNLNCEGGEKMKTQYIVLGIIAAAIVAGGFFFLNSQSIPKVSPSTENASIKQEKAMTDQGTEERMMGLGYIMKSGK